MEKAHRVNDFKCICRIQRPKYIHRHGRLEVLTALMLQIPVKWDVLCRQVYGYRCFIAWCWIRLQSQAVLCHTALNSWPWCWSSYEASKRPSLLMSQSFAKTEMTWILKQRCALLICISWRMLVLSLLKQTLTNLVNEVFTFDDLQCTVKRHLFHLQPEGGKKRPLRTLRHIWEDNIIMDL
jgi:hypothetical protein